MMGTSRVLLAAFTLAFMSSSAGFIFDDDDCIVKGFCSSLFGPKVEGGKRIKYLTPEMCHPASTGLMKVQADNFTMNIERNCPLLEYDSLYRQVDGTCNNVFNLGASAKPLARVLPAKYEDGREVPRTYGKNGRPLPNPRLVSLAVHPDVHSTTPLTIWVMQWGQYMDHDMVSTPLPVEDTRRTIKCCTEDRRRIRDDADPECFPIMFGRDRNFMGSCMEFVRSMPIKDRFDNVELPREHMNIVTSFIDASTVYGSDKERLEKVRAHGAESYLLRTTKDDYLPDNEMDDCIKRGPGDYCFLAGDERVNEHPGLTVLHHVTVRLHNRIAHMLRYMRPLYSNEDVFQRARAIVIATVQKIMYADWLPIVLGPRAMLKGKLMAGVKRAKYDPMVDPTVPNSFGAAVFRFGHTLIPRTIPFGGSKPLLRDLFFKPFMVKGNVEQIVEGMCSGIDPEGRSQFPDPFIVEEVTNHLFETEEGLGRAFDLVALNIQRARDHGIPPYNDFREHCGLHRITTFQDPALGISQRALAAIYGHPDDIDLFSGSMAEPAVDGGLVGETFNCLMTNVFHNVKFGDRFFYETKGEKASFSDEELAEINKVTLSQVLCQTTAIRKIQIDVFRLPSKSNPEVSCDWLVRQGINLAKLVQNW